MGLLEKISKALTRGSQPEDYSYWVTARCSRCGEIIRSRVDLRNDLSIDYGKDGESQTYFCRKILMGESGHCFQRIEVELTFDLNRRLINRQINGGQFVDE